VSSKVVTSLVPYYRFDIQTMDDSRASGSKARRVFVITNPDNDSDSDENTRNARRPYGGRPPRDPNGSSSGRSNSRPQLAMELPYTQGAPLSKPALSPPSSTSSPVESTPPPSTPGKSGPSESNEYLRHTLRGEPSTNGVMNARAQRRPIPEPPQSVRIISLAP
jgi:hypothetical protein